MPTSSLRVVPPLVAALLLPSGLRAQDLEPACDGRRITAVEITSEPPAVIGRTPPGWARPVLRVLLQSPRTDESAVRPFLLLAEGDVCTAFRLAESTRLLRAQPYLADARIAAIPDGEGVRIVVETVDDVALIVGGGVRDGTLSRLRYGNGNMFGRGLLAAAEWERGGAYRDGWGGEFEHYHAFGGRQTVTLEAWRGPRDERYRAEVARPYLTDAQRIAWSVGYARDDGYLDFPAPGNEARSLDFARDAYGASWIARLGSRGGTVLAGLAAGHERGVPGATAVFVTDTGLALANAPQLTGRYARYEATRLGAVVGARALAFRPLLSLDSLGGSQDVASGVQLVGTVGYELAGGAPGGGADDDERTPFAVADVYAGLATAGSLTSLALVAEGRRAPTDGYDDVVASGRLAWYRRASPRRLHAVTAEFEGAWDARRPYRVALGSWQRGVRGYGGSRVAGARLAVLRLEERWAIGGFGGLAGFGAAAFADVGKVWAGDVPFGTTTGVRAGAGVGLLAAVPRRSQLVYRLDVAAPLARDRDARAFTVRVSRTLPFGAFWQDGGDLARARAAGPSAALLPPP